MKSLETTVGPRTKIIFPLLVLLVTGCGSKNEQVALPPTKVNVVKAIAHDVPFTKILLHRCTANPMSTFGLA